MTTNVTILSEVRIYVGTYAKYNSGSIFGEWLTLSDYNDLEEFFDACRELHNDESDPEFMFQDFEAPEGLEDYISESYINEDIFKAAEVLEEISDEGGLLSAWNEYCSENNADDQIFDFDEEFFNTFFYGRPMEAARAASFGDIQWGHNYIYFNGYGNLETTNNPENLIDKSVLIEWMIENR